MVKEEVTVRQFAEEIGVKSDRLLSQMQDAGITIASIDDAISKEQKEMLLRYLQQHHGAKQKQDAAPEKIVLRRAKTSEIKLGGSHHSGKTVSIQVRKKRTYVKRSVLEDETGKPKSDEAENFEALEASLDGPTPVTEGMLEISASQAATEAVAQSSMEQAVAAEASAEPAAMGTEKADDKNKPVIKRKEKTRAELDLEEAEAERHKKKRKVRDTTRDVDKNFEALLSRGADLSRVFKQEDEDQTEAALRKAGKGRGHHGKVKVQAFTKPTSPMVKEVEIPETIILSELAARMSVKAAELIKALMKMGMIATINQAIDQ